MKDTDNIEKLNSLIEDLERAGSARPYDPDAYNNIVEDLNVLFDSKSKRRRRRPWLALLSCIVLLIILCYIVYEILELLWIRGTLL